MKRLADLLDRAAETPSLDRYAAPYQRLVNRVIPKGALRDTLHGVHVGHPIHPPLAQIPLGAWLSAGILDLFPGHDLASGTLVAVGLTAAAPTAVAGATDFSQLHEQQMRVGVLHAAANFIATTLYAASLVARVRRRPMRGRLLGYAGLATASLSGYIGGHLAYRMAAGANHAEAVPHLVQPGWHRLARLDELPAGQPVSVQLGAVPLLVIRQDSQVQVLAGQCSHLSGPLHEGKVAGSGEDAQIECPWHGSTFRLRDGAVIHGPATAPQPSLRTRIVDGAVEVELPGAG